MIHVQGGTTATLVHASAAPWLREAAAAAVDMIYADPPFGNRQDWVGEAGRFSDRWSWSEAAAECFGRLVAHAPAALDVLPAIAPDLRDRAYLATMADILLGAHHVLRRTGTLWLHFDDTMGAQLRILCDLIFGPSNALGLVTWKRSSAHNNARKFGRIHDTIACYGRSRAARWRLARIGDQTIVHGDPWAMFVEALLEDQLSAGSAERVGYPTQKPVALIERLIKAATLPGNIVLDPTCGSGTTVVAALRLGRSAIGIDQSSEAISTATTRLQPVIATPEQGDLFGNAA